MNDFYLNLIVQGALYGLLVFSVLTWILIAGKGLQNWRLGSQDKHFAKQFWSAANLDVAAQLARDAGPKSRIAAVGFDALYVTDTTADIDLEHSWDRKELLERHLRQQIQKEYASREAGLAVLASVGSTAPFVGLFGTVFGIIHALGAISKNASASIDVVAGPIGEALIATGVGIAVAVPAVLAFNFYVRRLKVAALELDNFANDLLNLAQKSGYRIARLATVSRQQGSTQAAAQGAYA